MRRIRIFALGIVSFFAVLMSALLAPGTIVNRALSAALCTVFSFNSTVCTVNLVNSSDRVVAATPPAVERNIGDWLVRDPGEFDDAPSVPSGSNPQAPPFPQDPGPNQPLRPEFDDPGSRIDPSLVRPSPPSPDVDRAIDSATENATNEALLLTEKCDFSSVGTSRDEQKCFEANGNQCEGGVPSYPPRYNKDTCMVKMYVTPGSTAHDNCCVAHPRGYACNGYGNRKKEDPSNNTWDNVKSDCEAEWTQARDNLAYDLTFDGVPGVPMRGYWKEFGPYYSLTGTWTAKRDPFYTADREPGCHPGSLNAPSFGANEFIMVQSRQSISIPGNFGGWSSTSGSKGYGSAAGGTVSGKVFTLRSTEGGFTNEHTGTISSVKDGRNTITGRLVCSHSSGSAKAEGSFTFTRKKS